MNLFGRKKTPKLSKEERERAKRLRRTMTASTQNSLNYQWLMPDGLMKITNDQFSKTYRLGDTAILLQQMMSELISLKQTLIFLIRWILTMICSY